MAKEKVIHYLIGGRKTFHVGKCGSSSEDIAQFTRDVHGVTCKRCRRKIIAR